MKNGERWIYKEEKRKILQTLAIILKLYFCNSQAKPDFQMDRESRVPNPNSKNPLNKFYFTRSVPGHSVISPSFEAQHVLGPCFLCRAHFH